MINKTALLKPTPVNAIKYEDLVNYLFSIQDLYVYNPLAYEETISEIDIFLDCYEEVQLNGAIAGQQYYDMRLHKRYALNALHSIIHNMPHNINLTKKLNDSMLQLESILNVYMDKVEQLHNLYIHEHGYSTDITIIDKGIFARNIYDTSIEASTIAGEPIHYYDFY